ENLPAVVAEDPASYGNPAFLQGIDLKGLNELSILADLDKLKENIDQFRPFSEQVAYQLMQKFRYAWNYHSNAIEGNQLTYGETLTLIMHGLTAKGKPLKDHLDVQGHEKAVDLMLEMVKGVRKVSQYDVRQLHQLLLKETYQQGARTQSGEMVFRTINVGEYKRQPNHVRTADGSIHYYADPRDVPHRVAALLDWYDAVKDSGEIHPLVVATIFHHELVAIHPFDDGNGRMGRILMNFTLMRKGYPPIVISQKKRLGYYDALSKADFGDFLPLVKYLAQGLEQSLAIQFDGVSNGNIQPYRWPDTK
ncbi:MAG: Fic family protein, partial [Bacteroidota bacterium]